MNSETVNPADESADEKPAKPQRYRDSMENEKPWCWQSKPMIDHIVANIDKPERALLVYYTLTRLSSDKASNTFQATRGLIAANSGLSRNTIKAGSEELEEIGAIEVIKKREKGGPKWMTYTYRLLSCHTLTPSNADTVKGNGKVLCNSRKRCGVGNTTQHPHLKKKDAAAASCSSPSGAGISAAYKLRGLPEGSEQRRIAGIIHREQASQCKEADLGRFQSALYDSIIEAGLNPNKERVLERIKAKLAPAIEAKPDEVESVDEWA